MPGPVSDSLDPEWGTSSNAAAIREALDHMYDELSAIIGGSPMYIVDLVDADPDEMGPDLQCTLSEKEWRLLRFAVERARESL